MSYNTEDIERFTQHLKEMLDKAMVEREKYERREIARWIKLLAGEEIKDIEL